MLYGEPRVIHAEGAELIRRDPALI